MQEWRGQRGGYDENGKWQSSMFTTKTPQPLADKSAENKWWEDKSATNTEYTNMVTSITQNKGFYVARYEASENSDSTKAQSKRNQSVWNNIKQINAITKAKNYNTILHSHLMYGIEWDSILKWLEGNAQISSDTSGERKTIDESDLQTNSHRWGNYTNSVGDAATNCWSKQATGNSEYWKANNIYDLAGNIAEWTQERWSTGTGRAYRGGYYGTGGEDFPIALRIDNDEKSTGYTYIGFRVSFYL